ncbi:protein DETOXIFICATION 27 isoform X2 [Coffea arabica]|uniref:Protein DETOXIFICATION 27 isoform X2 n=1 Tax=Coffea arabica TaxID=13443 RepID=A0ABM4VYH7_COFAR
MGNWGELLLDGHPGEGELQKNVGIGKRFGIESKKLWMIAGPITLGAICQYSLNAITLTFVGFVGEIELAAVSIGNSVISGLAFRLMLTFAVGNRECPGDFMRTSIWRRTNKDTWDIHAEIMDNRCYHCHHFASHFHICSSCS